MYLSFKYNHVCNYVIVCLHSTTLNIESLVLNFNNNKSQTTHISRKKLCSLLEHKLKLLLWFLFKNV